MFLFSINLWIDFKVYNPSIVVLLILASVLVRVSVSNNPVVEEVYNIENEYYEQKRDTEEKVNNMVNGWEDIIL